MQVKNIVAELNSAKEGEFVQLLPFNQSHLGAVSIVGVSPVWEMHPDTDELFFVIDGTLQISLLSDDGIEHYVATAGESMVVPRGQWHKPAAPDGAKFIFLTPGQSLHSELDDPRV